MRILALPALAGAGVARRRLALFWRRAGRRGVVGGMGLLEQCEAAFGSPDLYRVLGVRREASPEEIRRGYHRASLRVHPDRAEPDAKEEATRRFQILSKAYAVLSDAEQRAVYDEQGTVDEEGEALRGERDWQEYWRLLFKKITVKDIEDFENKYKDSEEELADIKAAYMDFEGDMDRIMESVLCVNYTDEPRIRNIIEKAIAAGEVPSYKGFVKESKQKMMARKRRAEKEAREAEKTKDELGLCGEDDLKALIQSRNKDRKKEMDDFLAQLEAKYVNNAKKGGKKTAAKKGKK